MKKLWMATTVALVTVTIALLTMAYKPGTNEIKEIATVKVVQNVTHRLNSIYVTQSNGKQTLIDIPNIGGDYSKSAVAEANKKTIEILNIFSSKGFKLVSTGGGYYDHGFYDIYVFER